nr:hypothetical protein [Tanacetum cinerariifolium]
MAQLRCLNCGGLFNSRNYPSCSIVRYGNEFDHDPNPLPYDNTLIFLTNHHSTMLIHTRKRNKLFKATPSMIKEYRQREQTANLSTHTLEPLRRFNYICHDDDDDYDYKERLSHNGNEELYTILEKESDECIKSSVADLVPIPTVTFSNPLFDSNDDFISSNDKSLSDEDVPKDNVKIYSNPLFEFDDEYISSDVNPFFDEVLEDIECKDSYDPNLDELTFLVTPLSDSNEDEYFTSGDDVELLFHHNPSIPKMSLASILAGFTDEPPLEENADLFDLESKNDEWNKIFNDAQIDDLMFEDSF